MKMPSFATLWLLLFSGFFLSLSLSLSGCAQIPSEAPALSEELGKRVSAVEQSHLNLLHQFFAQKRASIDTFISEVWTPRFASEFFSDPNIARAWDTLAKENDEQQRFTFLLKTAPRLQQQINDKRHELMQPLDALERSIEDALRQEYAQMYAINSSITSFLLSASKVDENRNRYLEKAGIEPSRFDQVLNQTDEIVNKLLVGAGKAEVSLERAEEYKDKLQALRKSL